MLFILIAIVILLMILAILVYFFVLKNHTSLPPMQTYKADTFTVAYPQSWHANKVDYYHMYVFAQHIPSSDYHYPGLTVEIKDAQSLKIEVDENITRGFIQQKCPYALPNCIFYDRKVIYENTPLYDGFIIVPKGDKNYFITFESVADQNLEENKTIYAAMINSMQLN